MSHHKTIATIAVNTFMATFFPTTNGKIRYSSKNCIPMYRISILIVIFMDPVNKLDATIAHIHHSIVPTVGTRVINAEPTEISHAYGTQNIVSHI
jgi:hypothetical protein